MNTRKLLLLAAAIGIAIFMIFKDQDFNSTSSQEVYYSDFLRQVNSGNVRKVLIEHNVIYATDSSDQTYRVIAPDKHDITSLLRQQNVAIEVKERSGMPWYISILLNWGPMLLLIGVWIYFFRRMNSGGGMNKIFSIGKSKARKIEKEQMQVRFEHVAGADESKEDLKEIVDFLKSPEKFSDIGGKIPKGVLMIGPPGTGKTLLAKAVAGEADVPFFSISGSDFVEMFVGVGASRVRSLFQEARESTPCIIFIDEIDAVGRHRGAGLGGGHDEREQTLNQILVEMDGFGTGSNIIIIAATNRADILDPALLRPGRFDRQVHVSLPDIKSREAILKVHAKNVTMSKKVDLATIARGTPGFSGSELANLINEAALWAVRKGKRSIGMKELEWARDKVMMGAARKSLSMTEEEKRNTAYHEAGHALVSAYVEESDPVHKITIVPRGHALGLTAFLPEDDQVTHSKTSLISRIVVALGGRAADEIFTNERNSGAEGDLKHATEIAYNMVCKWGMSQSLGALTVKNSTGSFLAMDYYQKDDQVSDDLQDSVDDEVQALLQNCYQQALQILKTHQDKLHLVAEALMEKETISGKYFLKLIGQVEEPLPASD